MARKIGEAPQMRHHKASGRAFVRCAGKHHYLGPWNSPDARRAYAEWIKRWEAAHVAKEAAPGAATISVGSTVADLVDAFLTWAEVRYKGNGREKGASRQFDVALRPLVASHASRSPDAVLGRDLVAIVQRWNAEGKARGYVNANLKRIKQVFRWGVPRGLVDEMTDARLSRVQGLAVGEGRETDEVQPAPADDVLATLKQLEDEGRHAFAAMCRLQELCGARPGEVCRMRLDELHRENLRAGGRTIDVPPGVIVFAPTTHKTRSKGKFVCYVLGPQCQEIAAPWIALAEADVTEGREGFLFRGRTANKAAPHYHDGYYSMAVGDAAVEACGRRWSPNQLRHNFLTRWDAEVGIELGSAAVRHGSLATTAIYVQRDLSRVGPVALRLG